MWRHYLLGRKFMIMLDHSGLNYLFGKHKLNSRQARLLVMLGEFDFEIKHICPKSNARKEKWLVMLSEFDFEIKHIKGKENNIVYALSRRIQVNHMALVS